MKLLTIKKCKDTATGTNAADMTAPTPPKRCRDRDIGNKFLLY